MLAWSLKMDKKAALKKEEETKSLQLTLLQKQILQALYTNAFFKSQQQLCYRQKIKKYKRFLYRRKKHQLKKHHMMHLQYDCYVLLQQPKPNITPRAELIHKYGIFSNSKDLMSTPKDQFIHNMQAAYL